MTQKEVAKDLGISLNTISELEQGIYKRDKKQIIKFNNRTKTIMMKFAGNTEIGESGNIELKQVGEE